MENKKEKKRKVNVGTCRWVEEAMAIKKLLWAESFSFSPFFRFTLILLTTRPYMWVFKRYLVRFVGGLILVKNFYSIDN